ncbi:MAG: BspA family leucine-rich repeat surface protein, partial [Spirochaetota bacterium]
YMFDGAAKFNSDISGWNTSQVTDMTGMFRGAESFNRPLNGPSAGASSGISAAKDGEEKAGKWDTSNVKSMKELFAGAKQFNQDLSDWELPNVEDMSGMFKDTEEFNQPIEWKTPKVKDASSMFENAKKFDKPIEKWQAPKLEKTQGMFKNTEKFNQPIENWKTPEVKDASSMFEGAKKFEKPLKKWKVPKVEKAKDMVKDSGLARKAKAQAKPQAGGQAGGQAKPEDFSNYLPQAMPKQAQQQAKKSVEETPAPQPQTALDKPVLKAKAASATSITVTWGQVNNAAGYTVYHSKDTIADTPAGSGEDVGTALTKTFSGLDAGTRYYFRVVAKAAANGDYLDSPLSAQVSETTSAKIRLGNPSSVGVYGVGETTSMGLQWSPVPNADRYAIHYKVKGSQGAYTKVEQAFTKVNLGSGFGESYRYKLTGLQIGTKYDFRFQALAAANSDYVDGDRVKGFGAATNAAAPTGVNVPSDTRKATSLVVSWTAPSDTTGVTGYEIAWGNSDGATTNTETVSGASTLSHKIITGLPASGQTVYIQVRSKGNPPGAPVSAWAKAAPVTLPSKTALPAPAITATTALSV